VLTVESLCPPPAPALSASESGSNEHDAVEVGIHARLHLYEILSHHYQKQKPQPEVTVVEPSAVHTSTQGYWFHALQHCCCPLGAEAHRVGGV
jgi:hypothetical protein